MGFMLVPKSDFQIPLEADTIRPDLFEGLDLDEIRSLQVYEGNIKRPLGEFFEIVETAHEDQLIRIDGDVSRVKYIGSGMESGKIIINGDVGLQLGCEMNGGEIEVNGNVSSWIGMEMHGGTIKINGNAGDYVGCAYRGEWRGMKGGKIIIQGNAGNNIGGGMMAGEIYIGGDAGNFCGIRMKGGEITVRGNAGRAPGAEMVSGIIKIHGRISSLLPGFKEISTFKEDGSLMILFKGDLSEKNPDGNLYINYNKNLHILENETDEERVITKKGIKVIYNSGSTIREGQIIKGGNKLTDDYIDECARCCINPEDYKLLGEPENVVVSSHGNEVVLRAVEDPGIQMGTIFIPRGIWANVLTPPYTESTGSPMYKGVPVYLRKASPGERIKSAEELVEEYGVGK